MVLAADALTGFSRGAGIFRDAAGAQAAPKACGCGSDDAGAGSLEQAEGAFGADFGERA